jgi:NADPH:quinone reductase-like Zn-dependent oxidoreductase
MPAVHSIPDDRRLELTCTAWADAPRLEVRSVEVPVAMAHEVLVRVAATSVNPIDVRRATGYGRRLLRVKGAATLPVVLGNDLAGVVEAVGSRVSAFVPGQRVFGLVGTGRAGGAHASHVLVPQDQLVVVDEPVPFDLLAVLPYSFTTMWRAVASTGLAPANARGRRVLINGANGGLGRLALQLLRTWGSRASAICALGTREECLALGADRAIERSTEAIESLPVDFDVTLNFGGWHDDSLLVAHLKRDALGHATTVHPLLDNFDRLGWVRGAIASRREWRRMQSLVAAYAPNARYGWTVFKPDRPALEALGELVTARRLGLPVGIASALEDAAVAFAHVAAGKPGRAVLLTA